MPSMSATCSMAGRDSHPSCSCARIRIGMIAEACRPGGNLVTWASAHSRLAGVNSNEAG